MAARVAPEPGLRGEWSGATGLDRAVARPPGLASYKPPVTGCGGVAEKAGRGPPAQPDSEKALPRPVLPLVERSGLLARSARGLSQSLAQLGDLP